ncbi:Cytochrome b6-f complex subunit 7 [Quillaja saponaria]|uniref:Cytochrome b6-f complex subunit 7 n=1 Tax=Quillaja saponaria TaxID=32244 RepID=A0AAD7P885_QUISA|nr:Cytochrome b6-f complex subunit 7 [Quillaja saponaria]
MATASATLSPATITVASATICSSRRRKNNVNYITGLNSFGGLKAQNSVTSLGLPVCTEQSFAKVVSSLKFPSQSKGRGGGALSSTCNAAGEIFRIAAILNGLVLVGVAVGFVLLRIEAFVEEAES